MVKSVLEIQHAILRIMSENSLEFHHIGVATDNLEKAIEVYAFLGYSLQHQEIYHDPIQQVNIVFVAKTGHPLVELISPATENSPIKAILNKMGASPYHSCFEVINIDMTIKFLREKRFVVISKPVPAVAFNGRKVAFLFQANIGIIELLEAKI